MYFHTQGSAVILNAYGIFKLNYKTTLNLFSMQKLNKRS